MLSNRVGGIGNRCRTTSCVISTGTQKYLKATGNGETGQPPVQSNQAGTRKYLMETGNEETGHPQVQSNRAGGWGNHDRATNYGLRKGNWERGNWPSTCAVKSGKWLGYMQISKVNWEWGNTPTTSAVKMGTWLAKSLLENCALSTGTSKYPKATRNGETGQPPVPSNRASGWRNHCWTPV
ncbi:hypothetical protein L3X38_011891 [Prunus dulcis]|uniref:Uncharacterized protein n=1 Tax=Prunus dulcis TaxID=3755 RepID=A0AAD4WJX4_PRUDU|nr:hypothetical protein L3X38_011891 [Prunus dulcis]